MDFKISDVSRSVVSRFAFGLMACCVISYNISMSAHHGDVTMGAYSLISVGGITLLAWIIWFFYMYIGGKKVLTLPRIPGIVTEAISWIIFILWILSDFVSLARHSLLGICAWCLYATSIIFCIVYYCKNGWSDYKS